ncbi:MAG: lipoprotein [Methylococcales bacterium]
MSKANVYVVTGLLSLLLSYTGCGQKGPLYQDKSPEAEAKSAKIEGKERRKERRKKREGLEQPNESQPGITY